MNCRVLSTVYLRANGLIPCDDDCGIGISLGEVESAETWSIDHLFNNDKYQHLRKAFAAGIPPWENVCENCALFNRGEPYIDKITEKEIDFLQIETSLHCSLSCLCCTRADEIKTVQKPHLLELTTFKRLLHSCKESRFKVNLIQYCGHGEPLSHPKFSDFLEAARLILPETLQRLDTNGNFNYYDSIKGRHIDQIIVSCDGLYQESYSKYRVNGSVSKALRFMEDAKSSKVGKTPKLIWKYILFEFNDTEEEIIAAQKRAMSIGVNRLQFIITSSNFSSKRFSINNLQEFPIVSNSAFIEFTPQVARIWRIGRLIDKPSWKTKFRNRFMGRIYNNKVLLDLNSKIMLTYFVVDRIYVSEDRYLVIQGWAVDKRGADLNSISANFNGNFLAKSHLGMWRPDVVSIYPELRNDESGFLLIGMLPIYPREPVDITLILTTCDGITETFVMQYTFGEPTKFIEHQH